MGLATALGGTGVSTGGLLSGLFGSGSGGSPTVTNPVTGLQMANPNYVAPGLFNSLFSSSSNSSTNNAGGYTPAQTQSAIDATTAANMAPANPNSTLDPSQLPADSGGE